MSDVQFDGEQWSRAPIGGNDKPKGLIGFVIKNGLAKDERQANIILIIFLVVAVAITIFIFFFSISHTNKQNIPVDIKQINQSQFSNFH